MSRSTILLIALTIGGAALTGCTNTETGDSSTGAEALGEDAPQALRVQLPEEPAQTTPEEVAGREAHGVSPEETTEVDEVVEESTIARFEIEVRSGENLVLLADWAEVSVEELTGLNGIDATEFIVPGQTISIPLADEAGGDGTTSFHVAREAATDLRMERYFARRGGLDRVDEHVVRTGETGWGIAHDQAGVPTWVLARLNPEANLDRLRIGQRLQVPVLGDSIVVAAEDEAGDAIDFIEAEAPVGEIVFELEPPAGEPEAFEVDEEEAAPEVPMGD